MRWVFADQLQRVSRGQVQIGKADRRGLPGQPPLEVGRIPNVRAVETFVNV